MVTSHTYRQKSVIPSAEIYELDPENRLLPCTCRLRMIRDQALAVSGLLSPEDRGASVNTHQPQGMGGGVIWKNNIAKIPVKNSTAEVSMFSGDES